MIYVIPDASTLTNKAHPWYNGKVMHMTYRRVYYTPVAYVSHWLQLIRYEFSYCCCQNLVATTIHIWVEYKWPIPLDKTHRPFMKSRLTGLHAISMTGIGLDKIFSTIPLLSCVNLRKAINHFHGFSRSVWWVQCSYYNRRWQFAIFISDDFI